MALALVKKIKSVLRIPTVHAADDPEAEAGGAMPTETDAGAAETNEAETARRTNIKSLDELLSSEFAPAEPEPEITPTKTEPAPDAEVPQENTPAEASPTSDAPEPEPAPAEPDAPKPAPETESPQEATAGEAPIAPEVLTESEPAPAETEATAEPEPAPPETLEAEIPAEPEPETTPPETEPAPAEPEPETTPPETDTAPAEPDAPEPEPKTEAPPKATAVEAPIAPEALTETDPAPAKTEATTESEPEPSISDKERQKLHTNALRFANGRTGLMGLLRRLRDSALIVAAFATKAFARSKKSASKRKAEKFDVSENVERAFSVGDESRPDADATEPEVAGDVAASVAGDETPDVKPVPAPTPDANKKSRKKPAAKKAKIKKNAAAASGETDAKDQAPPLDKAAAKKAQDKEKAALKKAKDSEKKAAKKAKEEAKKAAKAAKEEAKKAAKEAKEAAFAEKHPKKAAKRAEQAAKKEEKKAAKEAKKGAKPDKAADKAAKAAAKAAKKAQKEENKKPKLTKEEKFKLKLEKQATKHEKKIAKFERKAKKIEQKLNKKHQKKEIVQEKKDGKKAVKKEQRRIRKERKREIKKQKKYWLERGVGRVKRNASVVSLVILIIAALATSTTFLYKSDRVNIPILNNTVDAVIKAPFVVSAIKALDKPVRVAAEYAAIPVSYVIKLIQGEPKVEEMYFFEADKMERYTAFREANPDMPVDEAVWRVNAGADLNLYQDSIKITDFDKQPILINKFRSVPAEYEPRGMVQMPDNVLMRADPAAAAAFARLREAAASENLNITVASAYRSYEYQSLLYNPNVSDTREKPDNLLSRPGFSENQSGLAFDLSVNNGRMYDFAGTPEAAWVAENAEKYGFILRYPAGQEDVTGVRHQPWHLRYVGDEIVKTMRENDIETLEEYCVKFVDHKPGDTPEKPIKKDDSSMTEDTDGPI
jgi:D-alanyl-D-alanine carboxypeptidase